MVENLHEYHKKVSPQLYEILKHTIQNGRSYEWLEIYKDYYLYDRRVVNVFRLENSTIIMERLNGFLLNNHKEVEKLDMKTKRYIVNEVFDIYNKQWKFTSEYIKDFEIWSHNDFKLQNLMFVNGKVRLIDPETFRIRSLAIRENNMHYSKFFETYIKLMCMMDNDNKIDN